MSCSIVRIVLIEYTLYSYAMCECMEVFLKRYIICIYRTCNVFIPVVVVTNNVLISSHLRYGTVLRQLGHTDLSTVGLLLCSNACGCHVSDFCCLAITPIFIVSEIKQIIIIIIIIHSFIH